MVCAANLRSIVQAMIIYTTENKGYIPGSPATTGRFLWKADWTVGADANGNYSDSNCPTISQCWDWEAPLARIMQFDFDEGGSPASRLVNRFPRLRDAKQFTCPENQYLAPPFGTPSFPVGKMISYNTASQFLLLAPGATGKSGMVGVAETTTTVGTPSGYGCKYNQVGGAASKIYIADGARYTDQIAGPDTDLVFNGSGGGAFSEMGAFRPDSKSWNRKSAPGNGGSATRDPRLFAFRHGDARPGGPADSFRMNCGFFDGHVSPLGDLEASNPALWMPVNSTYDASDATYGLLPDAKAKYGSGKMIIP